MNITFSTETAIEFFLPLINELQEELGERFSASMHNWCGIGERPYPLPTWQVFLARNEAGEVVGLCSYYQQQGDLPEKYWIGWIGVLKRYRRMGIARKMLEFVRHEVEQRGGRELWVYTDQAGAEALYLAFGLQSAGRFSFTGLQQAAARGQEAVFRMTMP